MRALIQECLSALGYQVNALKAPQNASFPYIVHQVIADNKINDLLGMDDLENFSYQVDIYSFSYEELIQMSEEVVSALNAFDGFGAIINQVSDSMEQDGEVYRNTIDLKLWGLNK